MNRKQLGVTLVLICLMGLLFVGQGIFNDKFQLISLMNNNISDFTEYKDKNNEVSFLLPSEWATSDKTFPGNYITYHKNFSDSTLGIIGYVQLINYSEKDTALIEKDKGYIEYKIENYNVENYNNKNYSGYKTSFITSENDSKEFFNNVYYIKIKEGKIVKIMFKADEDNYRTNYQDIYKVVVDSVK